MLIALLAAFGLLSMSRSDRDDEYLDTEEVAALFKVPVWTVRKWRSTGRGPRGVRLGRHVRYLRSDCLTWAQHQADDAA